MRKSLLQTHRGPLRLLAHTHNRFGLPWILRRTALTNGASDLLSVALVEFSQGEVPLAQRRPFGSTPKDRCEQQREDQ